MTPRQHLTNALIGAVPPEWDVRTDPLHVDNLDTLALVVWTDHIDPGPTRGLATYSLRVRLMSPLTDPEQVDDQLDEALSTLLDIIERLDPITWETAERGVHDNTYHAYTLTVSMPVRKGT